MVNPSVRFATAADGQRIAYTEEGEGEPYVIVSTNGDVQLNRGVSFINGWADGLSPAHRVIFLDLRGTGLSPGQPSLDGWVRDVQAVFDAAQIGQAVLHGAWLGCAAAIAFAAREPDRVSKLILTTPFTEGREIEEDVPPGSIHRLSEIDFPRWVETVVNLLGVPDADAAAMRAIFTRQGAEAMNTLLAFYPSLDLHAELARISTPTLVLAYSEGGMGLDIPLAVAAALDDLGEVEGDLLDREAELVGPVHQVVELGGAQQRLGRNAAPVETDAAEVLALDQSDLAAELGGADRRDVAARPAADDDDIE